MKTVKTANGLKKIEDWDINLVPVQLRTILQDHRKTLIEKLITGGLETYVDYKFNTRVNSKQVQQLKHALDQLASDGIDIDLYRPVFEAVMHSEFTALDNAVFYGEIDKIIHLNLFQPELFQEGRQVFFGNLK